MRIVTVFYDTGNQERWDILESRNKRYEEIGLEVEVIRSNADGGEIYSYPGMVRKYLARYEGIVAVLDADVWCPVKQLEKAGVICEHGLPMCLSYGGIVEQDGQIIATEQVGGAMVFNWGVYCRDCGGENPHLRMWGDDDIERYERICRFYPVPMVRGRIYHYKHEHANITHPYTLSNLVEVDKARNMSKEAILEYAKTW